MAIKAVCFDVGETLVDEARLWRGWASYLGVSSTSFFSALDEIIESNQHHRAVFERFRPGLDLAAARRERAAYGDDDLFNASDLYPDAWPCLNSLRKRGYKIGIAGNQPCSAEKALGDCGFDVDFIASSARWGCEKPSPEFFARLIETAKLPACEVAYVGDRLDNDVLPAVQAGLIAVFIKRGPWARIHARRPEIAQATIVVDTLAELPDALTRFAPRS
jgi:HAD superfamily hydrolase (TIGR01549 family)